jgi:type IV/VI secretion system ImpK/VasF family protein
LQGKHYTPDVDALAHYLLCATIDELMMTNHLRIYGTMPIFPAFTPKTAEEVDPGQRFFDIINFIKERPHQYLDIIELAYYCLITGFEGEQRGQPNGRFVLDHWIEELYQLIKTFRVNKTHFLFKDPKRLELQVPSYKPWLTVSLLSLGIIFLSFTASFVLLQGKAKSVQFGHAIIDTWDK